MKKNLVDISLTELREFIKNSEQSCNESLSGLSLISLKLRLQYLILQNQFKDFSSFYNHYLENNDYRLLVNLNIIAQGNELFRDAECWDLFINEIKNNTTTDVCLFESGNFYDTVTLIICLERYNLLNKINITIVNLTNNSPFPFIHEYNEKDMEMGLINYSSLKSIIPLTDFIKKIQANKYHYTIPQINDIQTISYDKHLLNDFKYDAVIARNITLNYNFSFHEKLFNNYLHILKNKGVLFTGNKEGFKWCAQFKKITYDNKSIPIYKKL